MNNRYNDNENKIMVLINGSSEPMFVTARQFDCMIDEIFKYGDVIKPIPKTAVLCHKCDLILDTNLDRVMHTFCHYNLKEAYGEE